MPGRKGARARPPGRELTHLGEEVVHCSPCAPQLARVRLPALAEVSAAQGPGEPCVSRRDAQKLDPAGLPRRHLRLPLLGLRTFCLPEPQTRNASVPAAAFVSSGSKLLTPGRSARQRRTAGGTFLPGLGEGGGGRLRSAPHSLCTPARGAQGGQENSGHGASPGGGSPSSSAAAVRIRRPGLTGSQSHRDSRTGAHGPPRPLVRARPLARPAPPSTEPRPPSRPTRGSLATPCPSGSPRPQHAPTRASARLGLARPARPAPNFAQAPPTPRLGPPRAPGLGGGLGQSGLRTTSRLLPSPPRGGRGKLTPLW